MRKGFGLDMFACRIIYFCMSYDERYQVLSRHDINELRSSD